MATGLIGLQLGDEGKGKISHYLSNEFDVYCRFQGGGNAGHTIWHEGTKVVTHLLPVGIVNPNVLCVLGNGMVINPDALVAEVEEIAGLLGETVAALVRRIVISNKAHVTTGACLELDAKREETQNLGTTKTGIGPTYEAKINRSGTTMGHLVQSMFSAEFFKFKCLFSANVVNTEILLQDLSDQGERIFFEGAQGVLLDIDVGQYPFVTSSNCTASAIGTGAGFPMSKVSRVIGVTKPYSTRVGAGPFPSVMTEAQDNDIRRRGGEFGATTGRPRKCGWLDVFALEYAVKVGGATEIAICKMDVLNWMPEIPVCIGYELDGVKLGDISQFPYGAEWDRVEPIYENWPGWGEDQDYAPFFELLEEFVGVPVSLVSYGPGPEDTSEVRGGYLVAQAAK
jgi:adenylosuccinate synthase